MYLKRSKFQFVVTIQDNDYEMLKDEINEKFTQYELASQLDQFISQRPFLYYSHEYQFIKKQLDNIFNTLQINLSMVDNKNISNAKLLIIIVGLKAQLFCIPDQEYIQVIFYNCEINKMDYSQSKLSYLRKYITPDGQNNYRCNPVINQIIFSSESQLKKLYINTKDITNIIVSNQPQKDFIDLSQFFNLKSVYINQFVNSILLPEVIQLNFLFLFQPRYNQYRILNRTVNAKNLSLTNFDLSDIELISSNRIFCNSCTLSNYIVKRVVEFISCNNQIDTLILQENVKKIKLYHCRLNTLILSNYDLESLQICSVDNIIVDGLTIFEKNKSPYELDISAFKNLKYFNVYIASKQNFLLPCQLQSFSLYYKNSLCEQVELENIDLSYLSLLQNVNIDIIANNIQDIFMCEGKLQISHNFSKKSFYLKIKVKNVQSSKFQFYDYLQNIEVFEFYGLDHIKIQGQPDDIIDCSLFKNLESLKSHNCPNIKIINDILLI